MSKTRVFVSDADYANSLAAVRSLGKKGIEVVAGSSSRHAQAFYSRYCAERLVYPSLDDKDGFTDFVLKHLHADRIDVLLPIGYDANVAVSKHLAEFSKLTRVPVAGWEAMRIASDKSLTLKFAADLGVGIPRTYSSPDQVDSFPVVVKSTVGSGRMRYINSREELTNLEMSNAVIQEYVPGTGYGFFALMNRGEPRALFMHRRIREYPITGGASTAAESVFDEELKDIGLKLLKALSWHGVAMVEVKKDIRDGRFKLMEINPKFWGSLDLAIASGVDFPYLAVRMAVDGDVEPVLDYRTGVVFTWPLPYGVLHALAKPTSAWQSFRDCLNREVMSNIWPDDIVPNLVQAVSTLGAVAKRAGSGTLRYPHGVPRSTR